MKIAYIAHQIGGEITMNLLAIRDIVRKINLEEEDVVPFCPYYSDVRAMNDDVIAERRRGMKNNEFILRKGFVDELWLFGPRISSGMDAEIAVAIEMGIKIVNKSEFIKDTDIIKAGNK